MEGVGHNDVGNREDIYQLSGLLYRVFLDTAWPVCSLFFHCARSTDAFAKYAFEKPGFSERDELGSISCDSICGKTKVIL